MRDGAQYFTAPASSAQRRYEALRAYFLDEMPAAEVADRFGYSTASIHQMASLLRQGRLNLFTQTRPGPKGPRKATGQLRQRVLELRAAGHSVTEIAAACTGEGMPVSAQTCWQILDAEGLPRLPRRDDGRRGPPARLDPVKAAAAPGWPDVPADLPCDHAGLLLLLPAMTQAGLPDLVSSAGYPSTRDLSSWQSIGTLLLAKCARKPRVSHAGTLADDEGLAFTLGLTALPKATHLGTYSWRVRRESNQKLLTGLVQALRPLGLATGGQGFNCDFHAIRHHGDQAVLEKHYVPRRSQRTRAVLTFFAQDHATSDMVYSNADITKAEQAAEIIAFADYWNNAAGSDPGLLVFDSQLTTYKILGQLSGRGITWLTLRQRGKTELARLDALPASAWKTAVIARSAATGRAALHVGDWPEFARPDALVWVTVVFHGTAAWRNHGLIIFPLLFYRTSVQLRCPAAPPGGGLRPPGRPGGLGHLLVGHPALRRGFPGLVKGDASASSPATPEAPLTWAGVLRHPSCGRRGDAPHPVFPLSPPEPSLRRAGVRGGAPAGAGGARLGNERRPSPPPSGGRRGLLPGPRAGTWPSVPSRQACSYSPGGRPPVRRITRAVLYQLAHSLVAASTRAGVSHGPRWSMTSVLYRPMMLSASALS